MKPITHQPTKPVETLPDAKKQTTTPRGIQVLIEMLPVEKAKHLRWKAAFDAMYELLYG
jgi:hypothetical protein